MANKQFLQAAGDGTTVPAGYVGQKITWAVAPSTQTGLAALADWTNASITLDAGVWLVQANISGTYSTGATAGNNGNFLAQITDASNNVVQNMYKFMATGTSANQSVRIGGVLPFSFVATLSATTTYKIRVGKFDTAGTGSASVFNEVSAYSEFFAIRIA